jgi:hypothetical protein
VSGMDDFWLCALTEAERQSTGCYSTRPQLHSAAMYRELHAKGLTSDGALAALLGELPAPPEPSREGSERDEQG